MESENFHNFINKKLVVSIFVTNKLVYILFYFLIKFIIASAKSFGLEGQGGCKVAANILHGFDCNEELILENDCCKPKEIIKRKVPISGLCLEFSQL